MIDNLNAVLEYQKIDLQLRKVLDEIEKNEDNKKMEQARVEFNNAKVRIAESEKAAESVVHFFNNSQSYFEENSKKIDEISEKMAEAKSDEERKELVTQLEMLREKFADLEKRLAERREKSDTIIQSYLDANEKGKKMRQIYAVLKERMEKLRKEKEPQINELNNQLETLRAKVKPEMITQYQQLASEKKYPAFVPALKTDDGKNYRCFCGLTLSQKTKSELMDNGVCRCETCRRVIFKE